MLLNIHIKLQHQIKFHSILEQKMLFLVLSQVLTQREIKMHLSFLKDMLLSILAMILQEILNLITVTSSTGKMHMKNHLLKWVAGCSLSPMTYAVSLCIQT